MRRLLSQRAFEIRDLRGRIVGRAVAEGDLLVFRSQGRRIAFAQWERDGLHLYRANGRPVARIVERDQRVLVYGERGRYLGQFIEDVIEDQIVGYFVDALGQRHEQFLLEDGSPGLEVPEKDRYYSYSLDGDPGGFSTIRDGILYVYDDNGAELIRGVLEDQVLVLYDSEGEVQGYFRESGDRILAFDEAGVEIGHIAAAEGGAVHFYESGSTEPSLRVESSRDGTSR